MASHANGLAAPALPHVHGPHLVARLRGNFARDARRGLRLRQPGRPMVLRDLEVLFGLTNLGYGIGPHYGSALRGFGLIDVNHVRGEDELHAPMLPAKGDREMFADVTRRWLATIKTATKPGALVELPTAAETWAIRLRDVLVEFPVLLVRQKSRNRITPHDVRPFAAVKVSTERRFSSGGTMIQKSD